jgi:hypothetical protein
MLAVASTLAAAGCSDVLGIGGPRIVVSVAKQSGVGDPLLLQADIGGRRVEVESPRTLDDYDDRYREVRGPRFGDVRVHATVLTAGRDTLATVEFTQGFRRGDRHWISAVVGPDRPEGFCIGDLVAAPLRTAPAGADSLFVMYGGIPENAIC